MLFALGLGKRVVAVTHECDHPPAVAKLPQLTRSVIPEGLEPGEIDAAVRKRTNRGEALYELDGELLGELDVDLIVTQALCAVCAVSYGDVKAVAARLPTRPAVLSLDPGLLGEVLGDAVTLGTAAGSARAGRRLRDTLAARIDAVRQSIADASKPRVVALEWLDPPFVGGHWIPEMIEAAGGVDVLAEAGQRSETKSWEELAAAKPEVVVVMPCGLYADEAAGQAELYRAPLAELGAKRVVAVDAASSFSRPGPRLADGVELLGSVLHPDLVEPPDGLVCREVRAG